MKPLSAFVLTAALSAAIPMSPALADTIRLSTPRDGATLHSGGIDMSAYFLAAAEDAFEVAVTYVDNAQPYQPRQMIMALREGDQTTFALPELPSILYTFSRDDDAITIADGIGSPTRQLTKAVRSR